MTLAIPLEISYLCVSCDTIGNSAIRCPTCASEHGLMSVSAVFNRPARDMKLSDAEKMHVAISQIEEVFNVLMVPGVSR